MFVDGTLLALDAADESHLSDLPQILQTLTARGFVEQRESSSFAGSAEYSFGQAMLRDLVYETLISRQNEAYHRAMANWLASSERADEYLPLIAEHYEKAGDAAWAAVYLERAGDKALHLSAFVEALGFYTRVLAPTPAAAATPPLRSQRETSEAPPRGYPAGWSGGEGRLRIKQAEAHYRLSDFPAAHTALQAAWTPHLNRFAKNRDVPVW